MIRFFDIKAFLDANPEEGEALLCHQYSGGIPCLTDTSVEAIREGKLKFHSHFDYYNEALYLQRFSDVQNAVAHQQFSSGFEHFSLFGYREIVEHKRPWPPFREKEKKGLDQVIAIVGLPRSGLTLLTALLGCHSQVTPWFLPFSTRKDQAIEPFINSASIQEQYTKAFPDDRINQSTLLISETTSHQQSIDLLSKSLENCAKSGIQTRIIWINRNLNHTYLSQMEAASKYWGTGEQTIDQESYRKYIHFAHRGYGQILTLMDHHDHMILSYQYLSAFPQTVIEKIEQFAALREEKIEYPLDCIDPNKIAGDPGFFDHIAILKDREDERRIAWKIQENLPGALDKHSLLFLNEFNYMAKETGSSLFCKLSQYRSKLLNYHFDPDYYLHHYEDVRVSGSDPLEHYLAIGWRENRNPSGDFDTRWYRENIYDDGNTVPLLHYLMRGRFSIGLENIRDPYDSVKMEGLLLIDPQKYHITDDLLLEAPLFDDPQVSIIIPAYNEQHYTLACIEAVIRHTEHVSYEIIVMDDCSPHIQARQLGKYLKNILFFSNSENLGFLQNCNKGASFAQGSHLMFLNNDTNVQPGWLSSLVSLMAFSQKIGMVGSKLVYPDGQLQDAGGIIWREGNGWNYGRLDNPHKPEYNYVKEVDYLTGATMMIRKTVWDKIGGFDTRYIPAYYEDPDLAFEVRKAGYKVMYQPESLVIHFEGITNGRDLGSGVKRYQLINRKKFYEKWKAILEREHFSDGKRLFLARDRSAQKKHILFIDHYLPHYDQDAGSKATLHYLKLFVKNDIQVHFIGDNFYDYPETPYLGTLTQMGIEVLHGAWYGAHWQQWLRDNGPNMDYIILSRPHIAEKYIDTAREMSQAKIIYFGHDLHFLRERREYQIKQDPAILQSSIECLKRELDLSAKADMCYFFSDTEKKELHKINPFAAIDVVPLYIYDSFKHREKRVSQCKDILFVGGFSHTPNIDAMQWFCKSIWPIIEKTLPDITLYIIGSKPTEEIRALEKENIVVTGFVDDATLNRYYRTCRVAIAPLRYGAGIKGKVVDALYNGMPLVTTSIGAEGFENARSAMLIADQPEQFAEKVQMLYLDDALAERYAKGAEIYCRKYFSEAYAKEKMNLIFQEKEASDE